MTNLANLRAYLEIFVLRILFAKTTMFQQQLCSSCLRIIPNDVAGLWHLYLREAPFYTRDAMILDITSVYRTAI